MLVDKKPTSLIVLTPISKRDIELVKDTASFNYYIPSLNGLRAISILLVIMGHSLEQNLKSTDHLWILFLDNAKFGVNVFFVLSGFLITSMLLVEETKNNFISLKRFYLRRTFRIFPAYYFLLLVYLLLQAGGIFRLPTESWITSILYLKFLNWQLDWPTAHFWSLSIEEMFYLFWPLCFKKFPRYRNRIALLIVILVPVIRALDANFNSENSNELSFFLRVDAIMWGCIFALYKEYIQGLISKAAKASKLILLTPILVIGLLKVIEILNEPFDLHFGIFNVPIGGTMGSISQICIGLIIFISFTYKNGWYRFLNLPVLNIIGTLSYSLYLWQQLFFDKSLNSFSTFPLNFLFIVLIACFSYYVIEKPALRLKRRFEI
jgi:peptidoglycan/LPS O-acetylase OafA/YrhL